MGRITTTQYLRKPLVVDAVRITRGNFEQVAEWCQGDIRQDEVPGKGTKKFIRIRAHNPRNPRQTKAFVGDWILYTERGYKVYTNRAFHASFDDLMTVSFPREEGDSIVIGPECFAAKDGEVLCWKGTNYVPQGGAAESGTLIYADSEEPYDREGENETADETGETDLAKDLEKKAA